MVAVCVLGRRRRRLNLIINAEESRKSSDRVQVGRQFNLQILFIEQSTLHLFANVYVPIYRYTYIFVDDNGYFMKAQTQM